MIGIYAFEMLLPDFSPTITMEQGGFLSCSSRSATLLDKTNGIFKSFFPFPDQSKCIYSFSGTRDDKGVITGLDLDITLQFRPEPKMRIFRPISPRSSSSSSSESFDSVAATPRWPEYGAQSFGHDAVELFLPSYIGTIQQSTRPFFVGMFGLNVECVEKLLSERSLMILDPDMHLGYRRLFYEITKGKTPKMDHPLDGEETENVVQILSHIQENPISKIKPGLEPFQQFVKSKSEDPNFAINFFMNAYMTVQLLISHLSSVEEPTPTQAARLCQIEHLLHVLEREFIHDTWQELFPPLTQRLSQIDNCIKAMMKIEQIKAHLTGFPENIVRHSLSQMVRIAGVPDKKHGFIISKSLNLDEIFLCLKHLKEHLGDDLFFQCTSDIYGPFGTLACTLQEKTILLYTMRRLEQKQLHADEVQSILSHLTLLVHLWNDHADFFQKHAKTNLLWAFIETHIAQILPSRCDRSLLLTCVLLSQKEQDKNPLIY
jgi:hypothetical protein